MNPASTELQKARAYFAIETCHFASDYKQLVNHLEGLAAMFARTSQDQHRDLIGQFHNCAGRLPFVNDSDFGGLVLEVTADEIVDPKLQKILYTEALSRATWCAQSATSGGEGFARSNHSKRLELKVRNAILDSDLKSGITDE